MMISPAWMMKMVIGSFGLYTDGFAPSITPPCEGALLPVAVAEGADDAVVANEANAAVVDISADIGRKIERKNG